MCGKNLFSSSSGKTAEIIHFGIGLLCFVEDGIVSFVAYKQLCGLRSSCNVMTNEMRYNVSRQNVLSTTQKLQHGSLLETTFDLYSNNREIELCLLPTSITSYRGVSCQVLRWCTGLCRWLWDSSTAGSMAEEQQTSSVSRYSSSFTQNLCQGFSILQRSLFSNVVIISNLTIAIKAVSKN